LHAVAAIGSLVGHVAGQSPRSTLHFAPAPLHVARSVPPHALVYPHESGPGHEVSEVGSVAGQPGQLPYSMSVTLPVPLQNTVSVEPHGCE
jgi:hypothetical protein